MAAINSLDWKHASDLEWLDISGSGAPTFQQQLDLYRQLHDSRNSPAESTR